MNRLSGSTIAEDIARMPEAPASFRPVFECAECEDRGQILREVNGGIHSRECRCRRSKSVQQRLRRCGIPPKFAGVRLAEFKTAGVDPSVTMAAMMARGIVKSWPAHEKGLLLTGSCGIGKTHLAAALAAELVIERGASGRFWEEGDLLLQLKRGFSRQAGSLKRQERGEDVDDEVRSEGDVFEELKRVDVLVLDDLGSARVTEWSFDEMWQAIRARYNANLLTVMTSNLPNLGAGEGRMVGGVRQETLGDRIGARAWSRLQEMCRPVEMVGADFRRKMA